MTRENSLTWARLIDTTPAFRLSSRSSAKIGNTARNRLATTKAAAAAASTTSPTVGSGILSPRDTKKSVTKKSRTPDSRATTSVP